MWETLPNRTDWDCFKTPILRVILRTQNLLRVEHYAFSEVIRLFQSAGCVRNKLQFRTVCRQIHLIRVFSHTLCTCDYTHFLAQGVSVRISLHPRAIHDVTCWSVRLLSLRVCLFPVYLPLLPCLFHCLPVLCPAHHLQCRHRRGLKPLHSRTMRSIFPWRFTILPQVMGPSSSTTSTTQRLLRLSSRMNPAT